MSCILTLRDSCSSLTSTWSTASWELTLTSIAIQIFESSIGELLLTIVRVLGHRPLIKALVIGEAITLSADHGWISHCSSTDCVALSSLHWILWVSCPVVETLTSICQLTTACSHKVRVGWISTYTWHKCILIYLLIACLGCALVVVLVCLTTDSTHCDTTHASDCNTSIGACLNDSLLTYLELWKSSLVMHSLSAMSKTAWWIILVTRLWSSLSADHSFFFLLGLNQIAQILHLLLVEIIHICICQLSLMIGTTGTSCASNRCYNDRLTLLASSTIVELTRKLVLIVTCGKLLFHG